MFDSYSLLSLGQIVRQVFDVKNIIVWDKMNIGMGHYFRRQSEHIVRKQGEAACLAPRHTRYMAHKTHPSRAVHYQKPVELFEAMIASSMEPGEKSVVCDPFVGSGTAAVAALRQKEGFLCGMRHIHEGDLHGTGAGQLFRRPA